MIADIQEFAKDTVLRADVCVIGSGAAGITLAREFLGTKHSVIVLEAGGHRREEASQDPYRSVLTGLQHGGIHQGRVRTVGGATTLWAGQALPLFDIDFAKRDWVPYSGWPIDRTTLAPFYRRAEDVMQIPHVTNDERSWPADARVSYSADFIGYFSQFTSTPSFAQKYRDALAGAPNIRLLTHANVTALEANAQASSLDQVEVRSIEGHRLFVRARFFIVCAGGIESARLLLASTSVEGNGIGNARDLVGRFFGDHLGVAVPVKPLEKKRFDTAYNSARKNNIRYSVKIVASEALQQKRRMLHVGAEIFYPSGGDNPVTAAKDLLKIVRQPRRYGALPGALARVARRPHSIVAALYRFYAHGTPPSVGSTTPYLGIGGEQQPNPESRVTLSEEVDVLGMRRSALHWRLTENDSRSMMSYAEALAAEWKHLGIAWVDPDQFQMLGRENGDHGGYVDANHHMGTTRMGTDLATSVVDPDCQVHGYDNLYIGSSSVFPTGGFSNPTLTVLALCLRIGDRLKEQLAAA